MISKGSLIEPKTQKLKIIINNLTRQKEILLLGYFDEYNMTHSTCNH